MTTVRLPDHTSFPAGITFSALERYVGQQRRLSNRLRLRTTTDPRAVLVRRPGSGRADSGCRIRLVPTAGGRGFTGTARIPFDGLMRCVYAVPAVFFLVFAVQIPFNDGPWALTLLLLGLGSMSAPLGVPGKAGRRLPVLEDAADTLEKLFAILPGAHHTMAAYYLPNLWGVRHIRIEPWPPAVAAATVRRDWAAAGITPVPADQLPAGWEELDDEAIDRLVATSPDVVAGMVEETLRRHEVDGRWPGGPPSEPVPLVEWGTAPQPHPARFGAFRQALVFLVLPSLAVGLALAVTIALVG